MQRHARTDQGDLVVGVRPGGPWTRRSGMPRRAGRSRGRRPGWCAGTRRPAVSAICRTSWAVEVASAGYRTTEPCTARSAARSSSAICEGPSAPISTPAWEPTRRMFSLGDPGHADEVVGAGEERGEGGGERHVAADGEPAGRGHHLLLGDEHLEVALGAGLLELLGVGGVADLGVETTTSGRAARAARASPKASRVATLSPTP